MKVASGGRTYATEPIAVRVGGEQRQGETTPDVFAEAEVSGRHLCEGQQILYTFRLFTAVPFANVKFQAPSFEGFSARQIDDQKSYKKVVSDRRYDVVEVYFILVPLKAGHLQIGPALLGGDVLAGRKTRFSSPFGSIFNDPFFERSERKRKMLKTEAIDVQVRALPPYDGPGGFSGLVGQFRISAGLEKKAIKAGGIHDLVHSGFRRRQRNGRPSSRNRPARRSQGVPGRSGGKHLRRAAGVFRKKDLPNGAGTFGTRAV